MCTKILGYALISAVLIGTIFAMKMPISGKTTMPPSTAEALGDRPANDVQTGAGREDICLTPGCIHAASAVLLKMNRSIEPCDDFYKFACGGFLESMRIPDDKAGINIFSVVSDKVLEQLRTSIEDKSEPNEPKPFRLVKNLYKSCMNKTAIEAQGLEPLHKILKKLGGWPVIDGNEWNDGDFDWRTSIYKFRDAGYDFNYFIDISIAADLKNSTRRVINIDQPSLSIPREYLSKGFEDKKVQSYYSYMVDIAVILGAEKKRAMAELNESLFIEIQLANISVPSEIHRDAIQSYNPMTLIELTNNYPSVPWREYFDELLPPTISIEDNEISIVNVPSYISDLEQLMRTTPKRVQANYAIWRAVAASVSYLNDDMRKKQLSYITAWTGRTEFVPRWKECVDTVSRALPISAGAIYVRKYFNEKKKKDVVEMVMNIKEQFKKILQEVRWMKKGTLRSALKKVAAMSSHIAYPDELLDDNKLEKFYEKLELSEENYFENMRNLTLFVTESSFSTLRKPVNRSDWVSHARPATINAFYRFTENSIQLPAGILQDAFFSNDRPRYMNYGGIGFIIGHELTHGFDNTGRQFDKDGNLIDWWASSTKKKYLAQVKCIIHQYGNYTVEEVGLKLNGINTQGENIADNGGIKEAYRAYNKWVERNSPEQQLPGLPYTPKQMFWISAANIWCSKHRPETLKLLITTGMHNPNEFRVIGPLSNMPEFSEDFNCPIGSKMNPQNKCSVW